MDRDQSIRKLAALMERRAKSVVEWIERYDADLSRRAMLIATGESVLLAGEAFYMRRDLGQGVCLLALTPSRIIYASAFDSQGRPIREHIQAIRIGEMAEVSHSGKTLLDIFSRQNTDAFVVHLKDGRSIRFNVLHAKRWNAELQELMATSH